MTCILIITSVSAAEIDGNATADNSSVEMLSVGGDFQLEVSEDVPDEPDLVYNDTVYIDSRNFDDYFDNNVLKSRFSGKTLIFTQDFENLGKVSVRAKNVVIDGWNHTLKNTVFALEANNITLTNFNIVLDSEFKNNDYAGIVVYSNQASLVNLNIDYVVPTNVQAYAVYVYGDSYNPLKRFRMTGCTINFEGHNNDVNVYNVAVKLESCDDSIVENNTISTALPLKDIIFGADGAELASDLVLTVGIGGCDNVTFVGNTLISEVNKRPEHSYPSLDCMMISRSHNSLIANNSIYMTDFLTFPGVDNYLYGLDIYNLENLTAIANKISIITTGGKLAAGTAYPIQITGPINNVLITENDLYSFSNGPNIGIYSQNFYGETNLSITKNKINVTGLAGTHEWALVAGIESQDTHSVIINNTIEVHSVGDVSIDDNIYGVSYRQKTNGDHQYNIQDNTVFSDGYYSVNLLSSVNSTINNNLLVTYNPNAGNSNGYRYGDMSAHENMEFYNNRVVSAFDYFASRENNVDNGVEFNYNPINNGISNNVNGDRLSTGENNGRYSSNPLIPEYHAPSGDDEQHQGEIVPHEGDDSHDTFEDDNTSSQGAFNDNPSGSGNSSESRHSGDLPITFVNSNTEGGKVNANSYNGNRDYVVSNNSDATPSISGTDSLASQSKSTENLDSSDGGESSSVSKKVYEIEEKNEIDKFIPSVFFIIPVLILLFIGFRRKKSSLK